VETLGHGNHDLTFWYLFSKISLHTRILASFSIHFNSFRVCVCMCVCLCV
jgi:hypothetical protein